MSYFDVGCFADEMIIFLRQIREEDEGYEYTRRGSVSVMDRLLQTQLTPSLRTEAVDSSRVVDRVIRAFDR